MADTQATLAATAAQRRQEFERALDAVRADIFTAATIFKQMSELGDDVSFVRPGVQWLLLRIADKQTLPEVFTHFSGKMQAEVAKLSLSKQQALIDSGADATKPVKKTYTPRVMARPSDPVRREVFNGSVYSKPFSATPDAQIFLDHKRCGIVVGGTFVSAVKMRQALSALEGKQVKILPTPSQEKRVVETPIKFGNCKECGTALPKDAVRNLCDGCFDRMFK